MQPADDATTHPNPSPDGLTAAIVRPRRAATIGGFSISARFCLRLLTVSRFAGLWSFYIFGPLPSWKLDPYGLAGHSLA
jgi:hypothetical protein